MFTKDKPFFFIDGKYIRVTPFEVKPPKDIEFNEDFPNCCDFHSSIHRDLKMFIDKFPNSQRERDVVKNLGLGKEDLKYILETVPKQVKYVEQHIQNEKNKDDWYEDITDYIEYNLDSLGSPSFGQGTMIYALKHWIKNSTIELDQYKRDKLLVFFEPYLDPKKKIESADLNVLHSIHQKWIKSFPFELSYFEGLKPVLEKRMPFLSEKPRENRYSKIAKAKMHTESSFVDALVELTKSLLARIDSVKLVEQGKIDSFDQKKLEMIKEERKIKNMALLKQYNKQERRYIKTIKKWLKDEKEFFDELKMFEKQLTPKKSKLKKRSDVSFGVYPHNEEKLKSILFELNNQIHLLNEEKCSLNDLIKVLTSDKSPLNIEIHFGCYNGQVEYIIQKLEPYVKNFKNSTVGQSKIFYSKESKPNEKGVLKPLTAQNLYQSKNQTNHIDKKEVIDAIFEKFK